MKMNANELNKFPVVKERALGVLNTVKQVMDGTAKIDGTSLDNDSYLGSVKYEDKDLFLCTDFNKSMEASGDYSIKIQGNEDENSDLRKTDGVKVEKADMSFSATPLHLNKKAEGHVTGYEFSQDGGFMGPVNYDYKKKPETLFSDEKEIFVRDVGGFQQKVVVDKEGQIVEFEEK
jgi:hypothetical protein